MKLDLDLLRAFVAVIDSGTVSAAAGRTARTQAAVSLQMRRLEEAAGARLLARKDRRMVATEAGERLLSYARRMLALHDEALLAVSGSPLAGHVRLGVIQDFADSQVAAALARFARAHPSVRLDLTVEGTGRLLAALDGGRLDLVLASHLPRPDARAVAHAPMLWLGADGAPVDEWLAGEVPLALFDAPCPFRTAALEALDAAGLRWRVAVQSPSLSGLLAAARAGLAVTVRTAAAAAGLQPMPVLPPLGEAAFALYPARGMTAAAARLADLLAAECAANENSLRK